MLTTTTFKKIRTMTVLVMTITILILIILAYIHLLSPLLILITIISVITVSSEMPNGEYVITTKHQKGKTTNTS